MSVCYGQVKGRKHAALQPLPPAAPKAHAPLEARPVVVDGVLAFPCARDAADALGLSLPGVRKVLRGAQATSGGHTLEYAGGAS